MKPGVPKIVAWMFIVSIFYLGLALLSRYYYGDGGIMVAHLVYIVLLAMPLLCPPLMRRLTKN